MLLLNLTQVAAAFVAFEEEKALVFIALVLVYEVDEEVLFLYIAVMTPWFCDPLVVYVGELVITDLLIVHCPTAYLCTDVYHPDIAELYAPPSITTIAAIGYPLPV